MSLAGDTKTAGSRDRRSLERRRSESGDWVMDQAQLADFLRRRREALQPEDVGLSRGPRRRTDGLRREEVAALCDMSVDYYSRLEQQRGPRPSEQILAAIARGLRMTLDDATTCSGSPATTLPTAHRRGITSHQA